MEYMSLSNTLYISKWLKKTLVIVLFSILSFSAFSQSTSWIGGVDNRWRTSANWTNGVPTSSLNVVIGDGNYTGPYQPELRKGRGNGECLSLTIGTGSDVLTLDVTDGLNIDGDLIIGSLGTLNDNSSDLQILGDWLNSGSYVAGSTNRKVYFGGANQLIGGSSVTTFGKLYINSNTNVTLGQSIINSNLIDISGTLDPTENYTVTGSGDINIQSHGELVVKAATFNANYAHTGNTNSKKSTSIVNYASASLDQTVSVLSHDYEILKISGSSTKTLSENITIESDLIIEEGIFDLQNFTADRKRNGGSLSLAGNATLKIGGTNTFPDNYSDHLLASTSTVEYYGGNQVVTNESYGNLTLSSSSGAVTKTLPISALNIASNFTASASAGSLSFTAGNAINVNGAIALGVNTTFDGSNYNHSVNGSWINNGTFNGCSSTYTFSGANATLSGSGLNNFGSIIIRGSGIIAAASTSLTVCENFSTSSGGTFTHSSGGVGTLTMTGSSNTISGSSIIFDDLILSSSAVITTTSTFQVAGDFTNDGSFLASGGTMTMSGTGKVIEGSGTIQFNGLNVSGTITTDRDLSIASNLSVYGLLTATAGLTTFNGTSSFSGQANLYNINITSSATLEMGTSSVLGIAGAENLEVGATFDALSQRPNTIEYNGVGPQSPVIDTFSNLTFSNGNTKTAVFGLTIKDDLTIDPSTTFEAGSYTHKIGRNIINNGTFEAQTSTVELDDNNNAKITGITSFNNLTVNKGSLAEVNFESNINVVNLAVNSGSINTGSNELTITATRTGNGTILGTITRTHAFISGTDYYFEGPNNSINFTSITGTVSSITVVATSDQVNSFPSAASVNRSYDITVTGSGTYVVDMRLHYDDNEINGNDEASMTFWNDQNGGTWTDLSKTANDITNNWVELSGITELNYLWTISEGLIKYSWTGAVSSSWGNALNWLPLGNPSYQDVVHLGDRSFVNQPTISTTEEIKKITFDEVTPSTLTFGSTAVLNVNGNIRGLWTTDAQHTINIGDATLNTFSDVLLSDGTSNRDISIIINNGVLNLNNSIKHNGNASVDITGTGAINITGDYTYTSGAFNGGIGTVTYLGSRNQNVGNVEYGTLIIDKVSGIAEVTGATVVSQQLILTTGGQLDLSSNLNVLGDLTIGTGTTLSVSAADTLFLSGHWNQSGVFNPGIGVVVFDGTTDQTVGLTTFNDLVIDKSSGAFNVTGNININGNIIAENGLVEVSDYTISRTTTGGQATLGAGCTVRFGGTGLQVSNFASLITDPASTTEFYGTSARPISPINYGNLIISNGGSNVKYLVGPTTVLGDLTVNNGANLQADGQHLVLEGNFIMEGIFSADNGEVNLNGTSKTLSGDITFDDLVVNGSYDFSSGSVITNGHFQVTPTGDIDFAGVDLTMNGDVTNAGILRSSGMATITGTQVQNITLLNAISSTSTGVVNFNGTVSPVLNSTTSPIFATVNINNTAPIIASQPWTVVKQMNIASGATWEAGSFNHLFFGDFTNNGKVTSNGALIFQAASAVNIDLGTDFTTTNLVEFGGTGLINLSNNSSAYHSVIVSNTNAAGITSTSDWTLAQDMQIETGATLNGASYTFDLNGKWTNKGTFNGQTSTVQFNSIVGTDEITGGGIDNFHNITFTAGSQLTVPVNINVSGHFTHNGSSLILGGSVIVFQGNTASNIQGSSDILFDEVVINKTGGSSVNLTKDVTIDLFLDLESGYLDLNGNTLTINQQTGDAITRTNGYILSENTTNSSIVNWSVGNVTDTYEFPFGNVGGDYIPFIFELTSGDAGNLSVSTYAADMNNLPLPAGVTNLDREGSDNSANVVNRFYLINLNGDIAPVANVTFTASPSEIGSITGLQAQRWNGTEWEEPILGQTNTATSATVPNVSQFSPWTMSGNASPLPVELIDFNAKIATNSVELKWNTASEINNDYFVVQRSSNGKDFTDIGKVNGHGSTNIIQSYQFDDSKPLIGNNFYRLNQVDFDGKNEYSHVVMVINNNITPIEIVIYPNPTADFVNILSKNEVENLNYTLYNGRGSIVSLTERTHQVSKQQTKLNLQNLERGGYILKIVEGSSVTYHKLIKK